MSTLTKEHFDQQVGKLATKRELQVQTKELKSYVDKQVGSVKHHTEDQIAELAAMVKKGFDSIEEKLDVRSKVEKLEREMKEIRTALHL